MMSYIEMASWIAIKLIAIAAGLKTLQVFWQWMYAMIATQRKKASALTALANAAPMLLEIAEKFHGLCLQVGTTAAKVDAAAADARAAKELSQSTDEIVHEIARDMKLPFGKFDANKVARQMDQEHRETDRK